MSARKFDLTTSSAKAIHQHTQMSLSASAVKIRKSGIEFHAENPIPPWTELAVDLQYPDSDKVHCNGVVVACDGNSQSGYAIYLLFTHLSPQSLARLSSYS